MRRRSSTPDLFLNVEALRALERCFSKHGGSGSREELPELLDFVWKLLTEIHDRRNNLSFQAMVHLMKSLLVVLPALGWPVRDPRVVSNIASRLAAAADDEQRLSPFGLPLKELCGAFRLLAQLAQIAKTRQPMPETVRAWAVVLQKASEHLQLVVFDGSGVSRRVGQADLEALAAAVELTTMYELAAPEAFISASTQRVDQLVAAAVAQRQAAGKGGDVKGVAVEAEAARDGGRRGSSGRGSSGRGRGRSDRQPGRRGGRESLSSATWRKPSASVEDSAPAEAARASAVVEGAVAVEAPSADLDVPALARVLAAWCRTKPGRPAPEASWLRRHAELVLRTQDPDTPKRLNALKQQLAELEGKLHGLDKQERAQLQKQKQEQQQPDADIQGADKGSASGSSMSGSRGRGQARGRGGGRGAHPRTEPRRGAAQSPEGVGRVAEGLKAKMSKVRAELKALTTSGGMLQQLAPLSNKDVVTLLVALASRLGEEAGADLGNLAEAVVKARMSRNLEPPFLVQATAAIANMGHVPEPAFLAEGLRELMPFLSKLDQKDVLQLLESWARFNFIPGRSHKVAVAEHIMEAVDAHGGLGEAPTALICQLCRSFGQWEVPFQKGHLVSLQVVVERRVLMSLPEETVSGLGARAQVVRSSSSSSAPAMSLDHLLYDVLLPLARLRQGFKNPEMFTQAVGHWSTQGFVGLDERKAALLLNAYAHNTTWPAVPQLRERLHELLHAALTLGSSCAADLSVLVLAASRAMRVMADKMQRPKGIPVLDVTDPRVALLVMPAVDRLLQLEPSAQHIARAAQGLFVELEWRGETHTRAAVGNRSSVDNDQPAAPEALALLVCMLEAADRSLETCNLRSYGYLLAACNAMRYTPRKTWLVALYRAAEASLGSRGSPPVDVLVGLLNGMTGVDYGSNSEEGSAAGDNDADPRAAAAAADDGANNENNREDDFNKAKQPLLLKLAVAVLAEPGALQALTRNPDDLAKAVRQLAVLGLHPEPDWLARYTQLAQSLLSSMSLKGVTHVAEGLALMNAQPSQVLLDTLIVRAERDLRSLSTYDPFLCGLLLGSMHKMQQNIYRSTQPSSLRRWREEMEKQADGELQQQQQGQVLEERLSGAAREAWGRVHMQLVTETRKGTGILSFRPEQLVLLASAVASHELTRAQNGFGGRGGGGGQGGGGRGRTGAAAVQDLTGRVTVEWLQDCTTGLLRGLPPSWGHGGPSGFLPPAELLINLLRLTSHVLYDTRPNTVARLLPVPEGTSSAESELRVTVTTYVRRAMSLLAQRSGDGNNGPMVRGRGGDPAFITGVEWHRLLDAAMSAGIQPAQIEVDSYAAALFGSVAELVEGSSSSLPETAGFSDDKKVVEEESTRKLQLSLAWDELKVAIDYVLLPMLPTAPGPDMLKQLREGLLVQSSAAAAVLEAASWQHLSSLCTYGLQVGPELLPEDWWPRLQAELRRRTTLPERPLELASLCYGLEVTGCRAPAAALLALQQGFDALAADERVQLSGHEQRWGRALPLLHLLWVCHRNNFLEAVPEHVWEEFCCGSSPVGSVLPLLQPLQSLEPLVAALAICYCLPIGDISGGGSSNTGGRRSGGSSNVPLLQHCVEVLVDRALPALVTSDQLLPLGDIPVFLEALERRAVPLPQPHLRAIVARLEGPAAAAAPSAAVEAKGASEGSDGSAPPLNGDAATPLTQLAQLGPVQAVRVVTLLLATRDIETVLPVLSVLMPSAADDVLREVLTDRLGQSVLSAGLEAGMFAAAGLDTPASRPAASLAVQVSAAAMASFVHQVLRLEGLPVSAGTPHGTAPRNAGGEGNHPQASPSHPQQQVSQTTLETVPPAELAKFAQALIDASGARPLSTPAAAVLMRLFLIDGVVRQVPNSYLERALCHSLTITGSRSRGKEATTADPVLPLPMPDGVCSMLIAQLMPAIRVKLGFSDLVSGLQRCGASSVQIQRVLLAVTDVESLTGEEVLVLLRALVDCGVREQLAFTQQPPVEPPPEATGSSRSSGGEARYPTSGGSFVALIVRLVKQLRRTAAYELSVRELAEVQRLLAVLLRRLDGLMCADFLDAFYIANRAVHSNRMLSDAEKDPDALFELLESSSALGSARFNRLSAKLLMLRSSAAFASEISTSPELEAAETASRVFQATILEAHASAIVVSQMGGYLIEPLELAKLAPVLMKLMLGHVEAIRRDGEAVPDLDQAYESRARQQLLKPRRLSQRQLGLLFGLLVSWGPSDPIIETTDLWKPLGPVALIRILAVHQLDQVAKRSDGSTAVEHLNFVLDALEPFTWTRLDRVWPDEIHEGPPPYTALLLEPVARLLSGGVENGDQPVFEGHDPLQDVIFLNKVADLDEESLRKQLFLLQPKNNSLAATAVEVPDDERSGTGGRIGPAVAFAEAKTRMRTKVQEAVVVFDSCPVMQLPAELLPPPGRRHGMPGDPAGDAAREAYVRAATPLLAVIGRLLRLLLMTRTFSQMVTLLRGSGLPLAMNGRWTRALGNLLVGDDHDRIMNDHERMQEMMEAQDAVARAQAEAVAAEAAKKAAVEAAQALRNPWAAWAALNAMLPLGDTTRLELAMGLEKQFFASLHETPGGTSNDETTEEAEDCGAAAEGQLSGRHGVGGIDAGNVGGEAAVAADSPEESQAGVAEAPAPSPPETTAFNPFDVTSAFKQKLSDLGYKVN
ncbi:hypothetical protein VOLCADRAFT_86469 [Volvox carteri f. nagariensis]|uniref:Uncharacterized protein n=1 Tax=Volvox carteri f. nagariensis TaxID=3068 RepID=D8TGS9_VOLCA|nr:uncharacterized protein VOLCADRAFT_86469 [Volvox carteri f. nagariensis]EFJ53313.1 hypothetical protein VOLCADRAFT_86469 [Volvox carteri f. nagariensis]|eukprot:XP_002946318.1 hypothetical protein VOLCADRAFT_86469 [Volvox carteri f. nagariensis]